jgi:hypothetical protein
MRCSPSWINFWFINGSFGDVTTRINYIKVFVADQILIGKCFEWSWYFEGQTEYSFECKMISGCLDKNIVRLPVVTWHAYLQKLKMADISFLSIKIFVEVSKIWKNGKRVLYIVLKFLSNEKIKKFTLSNLPFPLTLYFSIHQYIFPNYFSLLIINEKSTKVVFEIVKLLNVDLLFVFYYVVQ